METNITVKNAVLLALGSQSMLKNLVANKMLGSLKKMETSSWIQYHRGKEGSVATVFLSSKLTC